MNKWLRRNIIKSVNPILNHVIVSLKIELWDTKPDKDGNLKTSH